jgi:hypothetical protein
MAGKKKAKGKKAATKAQKVTRVVPVAAPAAVRDWPLLEVFSEGAAAKSRKAIANQYGKAVDGSGHAASHDHRVRASGSLRQE